MPISRKFGRVEDQRPENFVRDQVDGFGLAESQAGLELCSSVAAAQRVERVRDHHRFDRAGGFLKCGFELAHKGGWLFKTGYGDHDGSDVGTEAEKGIVAICKRSAIVLAGLV